MKKAEICLICRAALKYKGTPTFNDLQFSFLPRTLEVIIEKQEFISSEPVNSDASNNFYYLKFNIEVFFAVGVLVTDIMQELLVRVTSSEIVECELFEFELVSHS